jgi:hypothetical protein
VDQCLRLDHTATQVGMLHDVVVVVVQWIGGVLRSPYSSIVEIIYQNKTNHNYKMVRVSLKGHDLIVRVLCARLCLYLL